MDRARLEELIRRQLTHTVTTARNGRITTAALNAQVNAILNAADAYATAEAVKAVSS